MTPLNYFPRKKQNRNLGAGEELAKTKRDIFIEWGQPPLFHIFPRGSGVWGLGSGVWGLGSHSSISSKSRSLFVFPESRWNIPVRRLTAPVYPIAGR